MGKKEERDFKVDVTIDKFNLDEECEQHASIYRYWAEARARARARAERAVEEVKKVKAQVDIETRKQIAKGKDLGFKPSETSIATFRDQNERVILAREARVDAWEDYGVYDSAVQAMEHRRTELSNLVDLWMKSYYAGPQSRQRDEVDDAAADVRRNLNKGKRSEETEEDA